MIGEKMRNWIIAVVTVVWAVNFMAGLLPQFAYEPDQAINGIFMAIVGGLFALGARERSRGGSGTEPPPPPPPPKEGGGE